MFVLTMLVLIATGFTTIYYNYFRDYIWKVAHSRRQWIAEELRFIAPLILAGVIIVVAIATVWLHTEMIFSVFASFVAPVLAVLAVAALIAIMVTDHLYPRPRAKQRRG